MAETIESPVQLFEFLDQHKLRLELSIFDLATLLEGWNPDEAIVRALVAKRQGESYDEEELLFATMAMSVMILMGKGLDYDTAEAVVDQAMSKGDIHISYENGKLSIEIGEGIVAS